MPLSLEKVKAFEKTFSTSVLYSLLPEGISYIELCVEYLPLKIKSLETVKEGEESPISEEDKESLAGAEYFIDRPLGSLVNCIITAQVRDTRKRALLRDFLKKVLWLIIEWMSLDSKALLKILLTIFTENSKYYLYSEKIGDMGHSMHVEESDEEESDEEPESMEVEQFTAEKRRLYNKSKTFVELINYFGSLQGFTKLIERIKNQTQKIRVEYLLYYLKSIEGIQRCLKSDFVKSFSLDLKDATFALLLEFNAEELKATSKTSFVSLVDFLSSLLQLSLPSEEVGKITEQFQLDVALKSLRSPSLEKRLQGLQAIVNLVELATRKENLYARYAGSSYGGTHVIRTNTTKWLTNDLLLSWIKENHVLDELFGEKMHQELLKRSSELFTLLAKKGALETSHIDSLWACCTGKQEEVMRAVYTIIGELANEETFGESSIQYLMTKIKEFPVKEYDIHLIKLLGELEECCNFKDIDRFEGFPLEFLWTVINDASGADEEVFTEALEIFVRPNGRIDSSDYFLSACIQNLANHTSAPQSLKILTAIISMYSTYTQQEPREQFIYRINESLNLLQLFLDDVGDAQDKEKEQKISSPYYSYLESLTIRFNFLELLIDQCPSMELTEDHLSFLWTRMIEKPLSTKEEESAFAFFVSISETMSETENERLIPFLFSQKLCSLPIPSLTLHGYICFEKYFVLTNAMSHKISIRNVVLSLDFDGMDFLWNLILSSSDDVSARACTFLSLLYQNLSPELRANLTVLKENLLRKIMKELSIATTTTGNVHQSSCIERCLGLLQTFVTVFDKKPDPTSSHAILSINLKLEDDRIPVRVYRTDTLLVLCNRATAYFRRMPAFQGMSVADVRLSYCGSILNPHTYATKTLESLNITNNATFIIRLHLDPEEEAAFSNPCADEDENETEKTSAKFFLANDTECFEQLFSLLDFDEIIGEKVWFLLSELPVNPNFLSHISNISPATNWDTILSPSSDLKLLYSLQIIKNTITGNQNDSAKQEEWKENFQTSHGLQRLLSIFLGTKNQSHDGVSAKKCFCELLHIIHIFLVKSTNKESSTPAMSSQMDSFELVEHIDEDFDYEGMILNSIYAIWSSAKSSGKEAERMFNIDIVRYAGSLLFVILFAKPQLIQILYNLDDLKGFVRCVVIEAGEAFIRIEMAQGINRLCTSLPELLGDDISLDPRSHFIPLLLDELASIPATTQTASQYFELTNALIDSILRVSDQSSQLIEKIQFDSGALAGMLKDLVIAHPILEISSMTEPDCVLIGLMNVLRTIVSLVPSVKENELVDFHVFVMKNCLFNLPVCDAPDEISPPACKTRESRKVAFELLFALVQDSPVNYTTLLSIIQELHLQDGKILTQWNYSPGEQQRSPTGYVGVLNLGCVCYMISLLQQLFMMPKFRKGILSLDKPNQSEETPLEDNLIYQLQNMFTHLQSSQKQYFDPTAFCKANKDYDGEPTDVSLQMDVDEFFNMLCEKIEEALKKTPYEKLLKNIWCGNLCSQLICQECKTNSERVEPFFTISLDLKNKQSIQEALDFYVEGELLTGGNKYFCAKCDTKVDALMRRCVKTLPPTLILHMKRFEFDFDTMRKHKLNDYCEFPMTMNLKPYTSEGIAELERQQEQHDQENNENAPVQPTTDESSPSTKEKEAELVIHDDDYYNYELVGILVHRGVAESGHYYSFIKVRNDDNTEANWMEFNDEVVSPFDIEKLPQECFGGVEKMAGDGRFPTREVSRTKNAYMLIYERSDAWKALNEIPAIENEKKEEFIVARKPEESFSVPVPSALHRDVWNDNMEFLLDNKLYDGEYHRFCAGLVRSYSIEENFNSSAKLTPPQEESISIFFSFYKRIVLHSDDKVAIVSYGEALCQNILSRSAPAAYLFLTFFSKKDLSDHLLLCSSSTSRLNIVEALCAAFEMVFHSERDLFIRGLQEEEEEENDESEDDESEDLDTMVGLLLATMTELLRNVPWYWRSMPEFFLFFERVSLMDFSLRFYFEEKGVIEAVTNLIERGTAHPSIKAPKMGDKFTSPDFVTAVGFLSVLVRGSTARPVNPYSLSGDPVDASIDFMTKKDFFQVAEKMENAESLGLAICFMAFENPRYSDFYAEMIKQGINDCEFNGLAKWFSLLTPFLAMNDSRSEHRCAFFLSSLLVIIKKFQKYPKFTTEICDQFFALRKNVDLFRDYIEANTSKWDWVARFKLQHGVQAQAAPRPPYASHVSTTHREY